MSIDDWIKDNITDKADEDGYIDTEIVIGHIRNLAGDLQKIEGERDAARVELERVAMEAKGYRISHAELSRANARLGGQLEQSDQAILALRTQIADLKQEKAELAADLETTKKDRAAAKREAKKAAKALKAVEASADDDDADGGDAGTSSSADGGSDAGDQGDGFGFGNQAA